MQTQSVNDLSEILNEFEKAMAAQVSSDDAASHYDLGMAYVEMGMSDQAIESFKLAAQSEAYLLRALEMVARCQIEAGRPEVAIEVVEPAAPTIRNARPPSTRGAAWPCSGSAIRPKPPRNSSGRWPSIPVSRPRAKGFSDSARTAPPPDPGAPGAYGRVKSLPL